MTSFLNFHQHTVHVWTISYAQHVVHDADSDPYYACKHVHKKMFGIAWYTATHVQLYYYAEMLEFGSI
jgi:hypothetical protein